MQSRLALMLLASLFLVSCSHSPAPPDPVAVQKDLQALQGTWEVVAAQQGGADVTKDCQARIPTLTFQNDSWVQNIDGNPLYVAQNSHIALNPSSNPKEMNHVLEKNENGQVSTLVYPCIYELDGDSLKLCWDVTLKQRPTKFATETGDEFFFVTLRGAEAKPAAPPESKSEAETEGKPAAKQ